VKMPREQRANVPGASRNHDVERTLQLIEIVPRWRARQKKAPELPPGQDYKATFNLVFAETPADRGAVLRHPITAKLEEIVYVVRVHLRPNE
jgi:hypothetical protein